MEATSPYSSNAQPVTTNAEDHVFGAQETADSTSDPVFNYVYYNGVDLTGGLFTWIQIGINTSASYSKSRSLAWGPAGLKRPYDPPCPWQQFANMNFSLQPLRTPSSSHPAVVSLPAAGAVVGLVDFPGALRMPRSPPRRPRNRRQ